MRTYVLNMRWALGASEVRNAVRREVSYAILAQRMLVVLRPGANRRLTEPERVILQQAADFLESAEKGNSTVLSLKLNANAGDDLTAVIWAARSQKPGRGQSPTAIRHLLKDIERTVDQLNSASDIIPESDDVTRALEFFSILADATEQATSRPPDLIRF